MFKEDPPKFFHLELLLVAKTPMFTIQCTDIKATVKHILHFLVKFGGDVQSIRVHTQFRDLVTSHERPTQFC